MLLMALGNPEMPTKSSREMGIAFSDVLGWEILQSRRALSWRIY